MIVTHTIRSFFRDYFRSSGRANRREYACYLSAMVILGITYITLDPYETFETWPARIVFLIGLIFSIPFFAASVRRFHDLNRTGWWALILLIPFIGTLLGIVLACLKGTPGDNRFGPPPKPLKG